MLRNEIQRTKMEAGGPVRDGRVWARRVHGGAMVKSSILGCFQEEKRIKG